MILKYICCSGCCEDDDEERQRLVGSSSRRNEYGSGNHGGSSASQKLAAASTKNNRTAAAISETDDEQAILQQILQKTADDVIDVSIGHTYSLDNTEYAERIKRYAHQLGALPSTNLPKKAYKSLLVDCSTQNQLERCLTAPLMINQDAELIKRHCQGMRKTFSEIKVEPTEEYIVQFKLQ